MTLKSDATFEEKLLVVWMSQNWDFDVILLSKLENFLVMCHDN